MLVTASPSADENSILAALDDLLSSPALADVGVYAETEVWLADLIAVNVPRTDILLETAFQRFQWGERRPSRFDAAAMFWVVDRRDDLRVLREMKRPKDINHSAFVALTARSRRELVLSVFLKPWRIRRVRDLLSIIRTKRPSLLNDLDAAAVTWWDDYFARPRLAPWALWFIVLAPVVATALVTRGSIQPSGRWLTTYVVLLSASVALALTYIFGVSWPRQLWKERWARKAPAWLRLGWAPATAFLLIASSLAPAVWPMSFAIMISGGGDRRLGTHHRGA